MFKTTIKRNKKESNQFEVKMTGMTAGKISALEQALKEYAEKSVVGYDVYVSVKQAMQIP